VKHEFNKDLQNLPRSYFFTCQSCIFPRPASLPADLSLSHLGLAKGCLETSTKKMWDLSTEMHLHLSTTRGSPARELLQSGDEKVKQEAKRETKVQLCLKPARLFTGQSSLRIWGLRHLATPLLGVKGMWLGGSWRQVTPQPAEDHGRWPWEAVGPPTAAPAALSSLQRERGKRLGRLSGHRWRSFLGMQAMALCCPSIRTTRRWHEQLNREAYNPFCLIAWPRLRPAVAPATMKSSRAEPS